MINLALALALQPPLSGPADRWVVELLASKPAQAVISKKRPCTRPSATSSAQASDRIDAFEARDENPVMIPEDLRLRIKAAQDAVLRTVDLIDEGKIERAYTFISSFGQADPVINDFVQSTVIDCELLSGRYKEAYRESVEFIEDHTGPRSWIGESYYLRLAFAAAGCGQVYAGQDEYCIKWFQRHYSESWSNETVDLAFTNKDPENAMILGALALGVSTSSTQAYLEYILKLDPTADVAGRLLVQYDQWQGRYSDLRRVASCMITHVRDAGAQDFYRDQITAVSGLADRPKLRQLPATP